MIPRFALALLALLLVALPIKGVDYHDLWTLYPQHPYYGRDLRMTHYVVGHAWNEGFRDVYNLPAFNEWAQPRGYELAPTEYPPLTYWLHWPLAGMDWPAYVKVYFGLNHLWVALTVVCLCWGFWPRWGGRILALGLLCGATLLISAPSVESLFAGQINHLLALLCTAFAVLWLRGHPRLAALPLALGIGLKLAPVVFLALLWRKGQRTAVALTLVVLAASVVPVCLSGWGGLYLGYLQNAGRVLATPNSFGNASLPALIHSVLQAVGLQGLAGPLGLAASLAFLAASYRRCSPTAPVRPRELGLFFLVMLICLTRSWAYYGFYAVLAWFLMWLEEPQVPSEEMDWLVVSTIIVLPLEVFGGHVGGAAWRVYMTTTFMSWFLNLWVYLGLWGVTWWLLRKRPA